MTVLSAQLLGPPRLHVGGESVAIRSSKAVALLCYVLATRQVHSRDRLAGLLWPEVPQRKALASLRTALYDIRRGLGEEGSEVLFVERARVGLMPGSSPQVDIALLEQLASGEGSISVEDALAAVEAYKGQFLEGMTLADAYEFEDWLFLERERLQGYYLMALCRLNEHYAAEGDHLRAADVARRVLAVDPLREDVHRSLMTHLAAAGQRAAALAQYEVCRDLLERELGVEPLAATQQLYERIRANEDVGVESRGPAALNRAAAARIAEPQLEPLPLVDDRFELVGRGAEFEALRSSYEAASSGHGGVIVLEGEAGIGKTRLVAELLAGIEDEATILIGRCHEATTTEPYGPVVDAFRRALPSLPLHELGLPDVWLRELARLLPELEAVLPEGSSSRLGGSRDRDRLFEAVRVLLAHLAQRRPVVWVVEDVHWSDETSLSLLSTVAHGAGGQRQLVIVTCRGEELDSARREMLLGLSRHGHRIELKSLSEEDTAQLIEALSRSPVRPRQFGRRLHRSTGGNPFFLIETLRALIEQGSISDDGETWTTAAVVAADEYAALPVPESVGLVVASRLARLSDDARSLLDCAAVLRRDFSFDIVQPVSQLTPGDALDALDELVTIGVLVEVPNEAERFQVAQYDFAHALVRDHVYGALTGARRQYLHRQVAGLLETMQPAAPDRIAYHYLRGGVRDRACAWSLRAGRAALDVYAGEDALVHFRTARELAVERDEEFGALSGIGRAFSSLGRHEEAIRSFRAALEVAPDVEERAELHRSIGRAHERQGAFDRSLEAYAAARRELRGRPLSLASIRIADGLATVYVRLGRHAEARELCQDALRWLEEHPHVEGAREAESWLRNTLGMSLMQDGRYEEAVNSLEQSLVLKRDMGDRLGEATLYNNLGVVYYHCGEDELAREKYAASLAIKTEIGDSYGRAIALTNLALMETHLGELDRAAELLAQAGDAARDVGASWLTPEIERVAAQRALAVGDIDTARDHADEALALAEELGVPSFIGVAHRVLGQVKALGGEDAAEASAHFETSLAVFEMLENHHELAKTHAVYGEVLLELGRQQEARPHLEVAFEEFSRTGASGRVRHISPLLEHDG